MVGICALSALSSLPIYFIYLRLLFYEAKHTTGYTTYRYHMNKGLYTLGRSRLGTGEFLLRLKFWKCFFLDPLFLIVNGKIASHTTRILR